MCPAVSAGMASEWSAGRLIKENLIMKACEIKAYAKINLGLDIIGVREDGYHLLRMVMQSIGLFDRLAFAKTGGGGIKLSFDSRFLPDGPKNHVYKAAQLICDEFGIRDGINVRIEKRIPIAAGLAGGSADAAATIIALDSLFELGLDASQMKAIGLKIGADVPFCLTGGTVAAEGIGERLTALPDMPKCHILLIKPGFGISTRRAYQAYDGNPAKTHPDIDALIDGVREMDLKKLCANMENVFEEIAFAEHPVLSDIKRQLLCAGALSALMSGSGPTVFAVFDDKDAASKAYNSFKCGEYGSGTFLTGPVKI